MKTRIPVLAAIVFITSAFCLCAWAQSTQVRIPFAFHIGEKTLPAGTYTLQVDPANPGKVKLTNQGTKAIAEAPVQTRLAWISDPPPESHLVFDKADEQHYLAELWIPGTDGFFLGGTGSMHTHVVIHGTAPR
jgi:hypothetical protein